MTGLTNTRQLLIGATIASVVLAFAYGMLLWRVIHVNQELVVAEQGIESDAIEDSRLRSIKALVQDTEEERNKLESYLVQEEGIVTFIETIEGFENDTGARVELASVGVRESGESSFEFLDLVIRAEGAWEDVYHFLALVEALPFSVAVRRANLEQETVAEKKTKTWILSLGISVAKHN